MITRAFCTAAALFRLRHRLLLHGVHPRKASDAVLLKGNGRAAFLAQRIESLQLGKALHQRGAGVIFGHGPTRCPTSTALVKDGG